MTAEIEAPVVEVPVKPAVQVKLVKTDPAPTEPTQPDKKSDTSGDYDEYGHYNGPEGFKPGFYYIPDGAGGITIGEGYDHGEAGHSGNKVRRLTEEICHYYTLISFE